MFLLYFQQHIKKKKKVKNFNNPQDTSVFVTEVVTWGILLFLLLKLIQIPLIVDLNHSILKSLTSCDITQVSFDVTDVKHFSFECCFLNNNCISTSITTPTNFVIKQQQNVKDKYCGPSSESYNSCLSCDKFHGYESINSELSLKDLTGTSYAVFNMLVNMLPDTSGNSTLNNYNKLLLFLMKIKLGVSFSAIGVMFKIHRTTVSRIFFYILYILSKKTKQFIFWPSKDTISATLPHALKKKLS